ncbi:hypothetical protein F5H01DRAFT_344844 [Linnemannia elongata]|nr:hypothetical protein F5H01DRAFT_344844 [Linnemannia elongata]
MLVQLKCLGTLLLVMTAGVSSVLKVYTTSYYYDQECSIVFLLRCVWVRKAGIVVYLLIWVANNGQAR